MTAGASEFLLTLFSREFCLAPPTRDVPVGPMDSGAIAIRGRTMIKFINMLRDKRGASAAEYALILAIIGAAIAIAAVTLGGEIAQAMNDAATCIETPNSANCD